MTVNAYRKRVDEALAILGVDAISVLIFRQPPGVDLSAKIEEIAKAMKARSLA